MDNDTRSEPDRQLEVPEQISKLLEEFVRSDGENSLLFKWFPVIDSAKLRPN